MCGDQTSLKIPGEPVLCRKEIALIILKIKINMIKYNKIDLNISRNL